MKISENKGKQNCPLPYLNIATSFMDWKLNSKGLNYEYL